MGISPTLIICYGNWRSRSLVFGEHQRHIVFLNGGGTSSPSISEATSLPFLLFNIPHQSNALPTISHTNSVICFWLVFFPLLSLSHSEPCLAQTGLSFPPRVENSDCHHISPFHLSAKEKKERRKQKKRRETTSLPGEALRKTKRTPEAARRRALAWYLFVPAESGGRMNELADFYFFKVAH